MFRSSGVNIAAVSEFGEFAVEVEVLLHYDVDGHQSVQRQIGPVVQEISYDSLDGEEALQSGSLAQQGIDAAVPYAPDIVGCHVERYHPDMF